MRLSRSTVVLTAVGVGVALAACGGSSKVTGLTRSAVVTTIDSEYTQDTGRNSGVLDAFILLSVDEGAIPVNVSVATDSGPLDMQLIGATLYDTAGGTVTDSLMLTVAWNADFSVYLITLVNGVVGEVLSPRPRVSVSSRQFAALRARLRLGARQVGVTPAGDTANIGLLQAATDSVALPDSVTVAMSEGPSSQGCVYQHITFTNQFFVNDSTALCNRVTITQSFALHFPAKFGVSARFAHMTMSPAQTADAARLALTAP